MKILVTGASGFVGSHVVELGLKSGHDMWAALRPSSSRQWLDRPGTRFIMLDEVAGSSERFDAVVWCAA